MQHPYRAPKELPPPPPDPMRTVLIATAALAMCGAAVVIGVGVRDAHGAKPVTSAAVASSSSAKIVVPDPPLKLRVESITAAGFCREGWCWEDPLPTGDDLVDVVSKPNDTWIATESPAGSSLVHWDGLKFSNIDVSSHVTALARAGDTIWAATREGNFLQSKGTTFVPVDAGNTAPLASMWAASDKDVWAVTTSGTILHYDGERWSPSRIPTKVELAQIRGRNANDVWAVGDGVILHYDGHAWTVAHKVAVGAMKQAVPTDGTCGNPAIAAKMHNAGLVHVRNIMALDRNDVWFVAGSGRAIHWNGTRWTDSDIGFDVRAMWTASPTDAWAVGYGRIARWNGATWTIEQRPTSESLRAIDGSASNDVWAVGELGRIRHYDGTRWTAVDHSTDASLNTLWVGDGTAWAGGRGSLIRRDATGWHRADAFIKPDDNINAIGGTRANDLWMFTAFHTPSHFNGTSWESVDGPKAAVFSIAAPAADDVWGWGALSLVHWDGTRWNDMSGGAYAVEDLWAPTKGSAWATARPLARAPLTPSNKYDFGSIVLIRRDGKTWNLVGPIQERGIGGLAPNDVWLAGTNVMRRDKDQWLTVFLGGPENSQRHIQAFAGNDVWVSGQGDVRHWDGTTVHVEPVPMWNPSVVINGPDMFAYGHRGGILHRTR